MIKCIKIDGITLDESIVSLINKYLKEIKGNNEEAKEVENKIIDIREW